MTPAAARTKKFYVRLLMGVIAVSLFAYTILDFVLSALAFNDPDKAYENSDSIGMAACFALGLIAAFLIRIVNSDDPEAVNLPPRSSDIDPLREVSYRPLPASRPWTDDGSP